jgi:hypothetical protein
MHTGRLDHYCIKKLYHIAPIRARLCCQIVTPLLARDCVVNLKRPYSRETVLSSCNASTRARLCLCKQFIVCTWISTIHFVYIRLYDANRTYSNKSRNPRSWFRFFGSSPKRYQSTFVWCASFVSCVSMCAWCVSLFV